MIESIRVTAPIRRCLPKKAYSPTEKAIVSNQFLSILDSKVAHKQGIFLQRKVLQNMKLWV